MKTKWGLNAFFCLLFMMSATSCQEQESHVDADVSSVDPEIKDIMGLLKVYDAVRGDDVDKYSLRLTYDEQGDIVSTIKKTREIFPGLVLLDPNPGSICKSETLNVGFARCAKKAAKDLGCIVVKTCAWCVYPCDDVASQQQQEEQKLD